MKKITIELSDGDVEEGTSLLHRAVETVDRLEALAEDLQELRDMVEELKELQNANKTKRSRPPVFNKR
jgi:hypothetical protein